MLKLQTFDMHKHMHKEVYMGSIDKMMDYAKSRWHKPRYVMGGGRIGKEASYQSSTDDCSSFVFKCGKVGGFLPESMSVSYTHLTLPTNREV